MICPTCHRAQLTEQPHRHPPTRPQPPLIDHQPGAFIRVLLRYADRAHDNDSGRAAVPEVVLRDAAAVIEDYRPRTALQAEAAAEAEGPEQAWLIERGQSEKQVPTVWYMGGGDQIGPEYGWTTDANKAQRYFSRDAAETAIEARSPLPSHRDRFGRATEHVFLLARLTPAMPEGEALRAHQPSDLHQYRIEPPGRLINGLYRLVDHGQPDPDPQLIDDGYLLEPEPLDDRIPVHLPNPYSGHPGVWPQPRTPIRRWALIAVLAIAGAIVLLLVAATWSASDSTAPRPGASGAIGSVDVSAQAMASASIRGLSTTSPSPAASPVSEPSPDGYGPGQPVESMPATPTGEVGTALSSGVAGIASWFDARGDQGAVPWWEPGQDPVRAEVCTLGGGRCVTVTITGWCGCLAGTERERAIDLSRGAFARLADPSVGLVRVRAEVGP